MPLSLNKLKLFLFLFIICNIFIFANHFMLERKIENDNGQPIFFKIRVFENRIFLKSEHSITILDNKGDFIKTIGQKGQGPGDFTSLTDFSIYRNKIFASDLSGKIVSYNKKGILLSEHRIEEESLYKIFKLENNFIYNFKKWVIDRSKKKKSAYQLVKFNIGKKEFFSFRDNSKINAYHPESKGKYMFPWFPNPFFNRYIAIRLDKAKIGIFFTREKFFYIYNLNKLKKVPFNFSFKENIITESEKKAFLKTCELNSHKIFHSKTKSSVVFPNTKELFWGAIKWDKSITLLLEDQFLIVSQNGEYLNSINYPERLKNRTFLDYNASPEDVFVKDKEHLYVLNEENNIEIFRYILKK